MEPRARTIFFDAAVTVAPVTVTATPLTATLNALAGATPPAVAKRLFASVKPRVMLFPASFTVAVEITGAV